MRPIDIVGPIEGEHLPPLCVSVKTARRLLGVGNSKMWQLISEGRVKTVMLGGQKKYVVYSSLEELIQELIKEAADKATLAQVLTE